MTMMIMMMMIMMMMMRRTTTTMMIMMMMMTMMMTMTMTRCECLRTENSVCSGGFQGQVVGQKLFHPGAEDLKCTMGQPPQKAPLWTRKLASNIKSK